MAKEKTSKTAGKTSKASVKVVAAPQAPVVAVATAADIAYAATLGRSAISRVDAPSTAQTDVFASDETQELLVTHATEIKMATGLDATAVATGAKESAASAARCARLAESTNRCIAEFEQIRKRVGPAEAELRSELRKLPPKSPLRPLLENVISNIVAAAGTEKALRTRKKNEKAKKPTA